MDTLHGNETSNCELEVRTKSGEFLLINATARRDSENNVIGVVGVAQDVTESNKNDLAVTVIANELRQLVEMAYAPIFGINVDGNVNEWNDEITDITGYCKEEAFNKRLLSI